MSTVLELLVQAQAGSSQAKEQLISENSGLVWSIVRRFQGRGVDTDDLFQLGCVGFLKAIDGFDTQYGTQFSTYAVPKIAGEIRRFLRDDGSIKVSRTLKEQAFLIHTTRSTMMLELDREPTVSELSHRLGMEPEEIAAAELATTSPESIQKESGEDGFSLENILTDTETEEIMIEKISIRKAVADLEAREREVILLRYFHGLTQQKTAQILGISQVQVSRIEKKAINVLRSMMS